MVLNDRATWRPEFHKHKDELIASINTQVSAIPGIVLGFSQPISDNVEEALTGVKGQLAVKIVGDDLSLRASKRPSGGAGSRATSPAGTRAWSTWAFFASSGRAICTSRSNASGPNATASASLTSSEPSRPASAAASRARSSKESGTTISCCATLLWTETVSTRFVDY